MSIQGSAKVSSRPSSQATGLDPLGDGAIDTPKSLLETSGTGSVRKLGRYHLCFQLAAGGMAKVYLARVQGPGGFEKLVAVKRIHESMAEMPDIVEMFLDEARLAARIDHPNVCSVFDFGEVDGSYYLAMEYLAGETLARVFKKIHEEWAWSEDELLPTLVAKIFANASEGLHAAHELRNERGELIHLIHRDISLANLFVTYEGAVKLMDFGVAKAADRIQTTKRGDVKGKFSYIAPERLKADHIEVDRRADIWSMGVVMWEFLTGHRLFRRRGHAETLLAVVQKEIPPPSKINDHVPEELDEIVLKCLERDRDKRWETARELGRALDMFNSSRSRTALTADVADLMEMLFPKERAKKQQMIELARQMGDDDVLKVDTAFARRDETGSLEPGSLTTDSMIGIPEASTDLLVPHRPGPSKVLLFAGAGAGALLTVALLFLLVSSENCACSGSDTTPPVAAISASGADVGREPGDPVHASTSPVVVDAVLAPDDSEAPADAGVSEPIVDAALRALAKAPEPPARSARDAGRSERSTPARIFSKAPPREGDRTTRPVTRRGSVVVVTPGGWADVYHGSKRLGRSPSRFKLPSGSQTLRFAPFGKRPFRTKRVNVLSGGTTRVVLRLGD